MNDYILNCSSKLVKKYKTRDPFETTSGMNIDIIFAYLGELKGFYKRDGHNRFFVINERLEDRQKKLCVLINWDMTNCIGIWRLIINAGIQRVRYEEPT